MYSRNKTYVNIFKNHRSQMKHPDTRYEKKTKNKKKPSGNYNRKWASSRMIVPARDMQHYWLIRVGDKKAMLVNI